MLFHIERIHLCMPVILQAGYYDPWLDREETERLPLELLRPFYSDDTEVHEANPKVGNFRNNGPEMIGWCKTAEGCVGG